MNEDPRFRSLLQGEARRLGLSMSPSQLRDLEAHYRLLNTWGARMNLTSIRELPDIVHRHFGEGLAAGALLADAGAHGTLLDLGSGNGFPGVPIRVVCPGADPLILVESSMKRAGFLRALLRELEWSESRVVVRRAEISGDLQDLSCAIFVTRGVSMFHLVREGLPFLRPGGWSILFSDRKRFQEAVPILPTSLRVEKEVPLPNRRTSLLLLRKLG